MKFVTGFFFVFTLLAGCASHEPVDEISIQWKDEQAVGILIPEKLAGKVNPMIASDIITVRLDNSSEGIFGKFVEKEGSLSFHPLIPFSRGMKYFLFKRDSLLGFIEIPLPDGEDSPEVTAIYPSSDTLPENALKVYITFSNSMRRGEALKYITLVDSEGDTVKNPFLDLTPELWNEEGNVLTLWFDPGRVKRDLQPHNLLGAPLERGKQYTLTIDAEWKDTRGANLLRHLSKDFHVTTRDSISPDVAEWEIKSPESGSGDRLIVRFNEALDYLLLISTLVVTDDKGIEIAGTFEAVENETALVFTPEAPWHAGTYFINIEARLEDLAGNNLARPFDIDISRKENMIQTTEKIFRREFVVP